MSGFKIEALKAPFATIGVLGLLGAAALWLVYGWFDLPVRILAVIGILFLGLYVAIDPEGVWQALTSRTAVFGGFTGLLAVLFIAVVALVNVLSVRYYHQRWDLTASKQFSLSDQSLKVLEGLPGPVHATVFVTPTDFRRQELEDLLKEYQVRSNGKFAYELVDPEVEPQRALALGVRESGTTVLQLGDKRQNTTGSQERDITSALIKLTSEPRKVYAVVGHGERQFDSFDDQSYSSLKTALEGDNFSVTPLTLAGAREVPADAAAVIIAGPQNPLLDEELQALGAYLDRGGKLIILAEPQTKANLNELVKRWNVQIGNELVLDPGQSLAPRGRAAPEIPVVARYGSSPIARGLNNFTFFPVATYIAVPSSPPDGVTISSVAETTDRSWATGDLQNPSFQQGRDKQGPLSLVVTIEADAPNAPQSAEGTPARARAVLFGDADFVSNSALQVASGNRDLFMNALNWAVGSEELVSIRPRPSDTRTMLLTGLQMNVILFSSVLFLPLLVLAAGAAVWWLRR
jgi:ABC-type uncharacterized transport system involved in gliding motility auxiliary subunit